MRRTLAAIGRTRRARSHRGWVRTPRRWRDGTRLEIGTKHLHREAALVVLGRGREKAGHPGGGQCHNERDGGVEQIVELRTCGAQACGLFAQMGRGFYVTELMGQGVNGVTGDYSRGATGFWIEGGEIAYPVQEVTIAGNLRDMFRQVVAIGSDVDLRGAIRTGSVLVDGLTIAGE
jgi:hypothetical protein